MKIVIPARYNSTRLKGKPLLELAGKPVIYHVVKQCMKAGFDLMDIFVATDDARIFDSLARLNIPVKYTSPNHMSGTDRINELATSEGWDEDTLVINVQGDEPLIPNDLIKNIAKFSTENPQFMISTAVTKVRDLAEFNNPNSVKAILGKDGRALYFTRSPSPFNRDEPSDFTNAFRHIGIYVYSVSVLRQLCSFPEARLEKVEKLEQLRALSNGMSIGAMIFDGEINHGIDTLEDYIKVKALMEHEG